MNSAENWQKMQRVGRPALSLNARPLFLCSLSVFLPFPFSSVAWVWPNTRGCPCCTCPSAAQAPAVCHSEHRPCSSLAASPASHSCRSCPLVCRPHTVPSSRPHLSSVLFNVLFAFRAHRFWVWWLCPFNHCRNLLHIWDPGLVHGPRGYQALTKSRHLPTLIGLTV